MKAESSRINQKECQYKRGLQNVVILHGKKLRPRMFNDILSSWLLVS